MLFRYQQYCVFGFRLMTNIKYFGFAKEGASVPVLGLTLSTSEEEDIKIQVSKVLGQLNQLDLKADERQRIKSQHGCWHCKKDSRGFTYLTLCSTSYPERHIYAAINQVKEHLQKLGDYETQPNSTLKLHTQETLQQVCRSYQTIQSFDKLATASIHLQDAKTRARQNTTRMMDNMANMQMLQHKSERIKENALLFEGQADQLQNQMYWRKLKIKIIIGVVIVSLLILIIVPIATKKTN